MEQLRVIATEDGALVLATETGQRFTLPVDDVVRAEIRKTRPESETRAVRPSPREIQSHIRAGLTAQQVADLLHCRVEDVTRFERPVLAEREHVVDQALSVPVLLGADFDADHVPTFGAAVRAKLADAHASGERWTSWKEEEGWVVKLEFASHDVEHDARWSFDPRRSTLSPLNSDATQLSRQGSLPEGLIPRLRALDSPPAKDDSRFDSGAFGQRRAETEAPEADTTSSVAAHEAAIKRAPEESQTSAETADLLEALRRRRGQRDHPVAEEAEHATAPASPVALFDALEPGYADAAEDDELELTRVSSDASRRKGRSAMPSWDEIVFGARTEE